MEEKEKGSMMTMGVSDASSPSLSSLLCQENNESFFDVDDEDTLLNSNNYVVLSENDKEYIEMLIEREISLGYKTHGSTDDDCSMIQLESSWFKSVRLDAVLWILKTRAFFGFRFQTAFLSITYFDLFLSKGTIDSWKKQRWAISLLSVACLTLAAKMEEPRRVPALSEFGIDEYNFETKVIQRMELLVLYTLEWRMCSITPPSTYVHYFITKFCCCCDEEQPPQPTDLVSKAVQFILAITKEMSLMDHRPSVIAAAAVLAATNQRLTRETMEFKMSTISSCCSLQNEHVYFCYNLMQKLELGKLKIPKFKLSSVVNTSFISADDTKRRRLTFDDCSKNCGGMSNEKHLL